MTLTDDCEQMAAKDSVSIETTAPAGWVDNDLCPKELNYEDYCLLDQATKDCSTPEVRLVEVGLINFEE
jgi:hypothetical protein